jgi:hypothetical protein
VLFEALIFLPIKLALSSHFLYTSVAACSIGLLVSSMGAIRLLEPKDIKPSGDIFCTTNSGSNYGSVNDEFACEQ